MDCNTAATAAESSGHGPHIGEKASAVDQAVHQQLQKHQAMGAKTVSEP